ncbi:MAG TPA: DNA polymerase, partial [Spirochaetota bacterium]|nr:DNA polymerase [Spirochaetota bacterium]
MAYIYVTDYEKLDYSLKLLKDSSVIAVDTETTGLDCFNNKIRLVQIASKNNPVIILDMFKLNKKEDLLKIKKLLESDKLKIFHNAKFDIKFLKCNFDITIDNYIYDMMIASQVYESGNRVGNYQLKSLAKDYLNIELDKSEQVSNWGAAELSCEQLEYACKDVEILLKLREFLNVKLKKEDLLQTALLEFEVIPVVVEMELNGFLIDPHKLSTLKECVIKEKEEHLKTLQTIMPKVDNFNSPRQVLVALNKIGVLVKSTDKQILKPLAKEFIEVDALLKYKKSDKWLGIIKKLLELRNPLTNRLHSQYNQNFTKTGRFSCYSPSIQQIPNKKEFRECFIARDGSVLIVADYSQI